MAPLPLVVDGATDLDFRRSSVSRCATPLRSNRGSEWEVTYSTDASRLDRRRVPVFAGAGRRLGDVWVLRPGTIFRRVSSPDKRIRWRCLAALAAVTSDVLLPSCDGHQFFWPIIEAKAGTVMVRTTNVSIRMPNPMMKPASAIV